MHDTAYELGGRFFEVYWEDGFNRILDVGSRDVNGTLRDFCPPRAEYVGLDLEAGPGVDILLQDPASFPFANDSFDLAVSTSCFEHDRMFWLTFGEMVRVLRIGGYIYISAPSNGPYHAYPYDNWRFYPDAGLALEAWAKRLGFQLTLCESFTAVRKREVWNDFVMVFQKHQGKPLARTHFICDEYREARNVRVHQNQDIRNFSADTEDLSLLHRAGEQHAVLTALVAERDAKIRALDKRVSKLEQSETRLRGKVEMLKARVTKLRHELKKVRLARSWRLTAPFRAIDARLKRLIGDSSS